MKDKFDACEIAGRSIVEDVLDGWGYKWNETLGKYDPFDIECTGDTGIAAIEVKYRSAYTSTQIESFKGGKGHLIECHKYQDLMDAYRLSGYTPIYWVTYSDRHIVWDLRYAEVKEAIDTYPTTTAIDGENKERKVLYLQRDDCKWEQERQETKY